jgi:NAD(P) transhydrogenase subunit alpha
MNLVSISENKNIEKRIAITPEIAKKYINLGFKLFIQNDYGAHLGFNDDEYKSIGVNFLQSEKELINNADIIIQLSLPNDENLALLKENQTLIGSLNAFSNKEKIKNLKSKKINCFSLELLKRKSNIYWGVKPL